MVNMLSHRMTSSGSKGGSTSTILCRGWCARSRRFASVCLSTLDSNTRRPVLRHRRKGAVGISQKPSTVQFQYLCF